jgi:excinuclease ABC subunit A
MGTFTGARKYVLHTFATTQSPLMKKRVSRFMVGAVCPACRGKRLKREALAVTFAGLDIGTLARLPLSEMAEVLRPRRRAGSMTARLPPRSDKRRAAPTPP